MLEERGAGEVGAKRPLDWGGGSFEVDKEPNDEPVGKSVVTRGRTTSLWGRAWHQCEPNEGPMALSVATRGGPNDEPMVTSVAM